MPKSTNDMKTTEVRAKWAQLEKLFHDLTANQREEITRSIGEVTLVWNRLHGHLGTMFVRIARTPNMDVAWAVWNSQNADMAQRKMLRAALEAENGYPKDLTKEAIDILNKVDSLSAKRNETIHTPIELCINRSGDPLYAPDVWTGSKYAKSLSGKDIVSEFKNHTKRVAHLCERTKAILGRFQNPSNN